MFAVGLQYMYIHTCTQVVGVVRESGAGFTRVTCVVEGLEDYAGYQIKIQAKNENYVARRVGVKGEELEVLACTPDLISIIDSNTGQSSRMPLYVHA